MFQLQCPFLPAFVQVAFVLHDGQTNKNRAKMQPKLASWRGSVGINEDGTSEEVFIFGCGFNPFEKYSLYMTYSQFVSFPKQRVEFQNKLKPPPSPGCLNEPSVSAFSGDWVVTPTYLGRLH